MTSSSLIAPLTAKKFIFDNYLVIQYSINKGYFALQGSHHSDNYLVIQGRVEMSIRTQLLKGILDGCVLSVIEKEVVYGYVLSQKLQQAGLKDVSEGTIYPVLLRLQKNGYIKGEMRPSPAGPDRKYYEITPLGKEALQEIKEQWAAIAQPITVLLGGESI